MGCLLYLTGTVQIVFIILKFLKLISWRWLLVFSPTWIFILFIVLIIIKVKIDEWMGGYYDD